MTGNRRFTDEELTSYLDGEAHPELRQEIERAVAIDQVAAARVQALTVKTGVIKSAFGDLLAAAPHPPAVLEQTIDQPPSNARPFNTYYAAAVACMLLVAGAFAGHLINYPQQPAWQDYAAKYHALYVKETLTAVPTDKQGLDRSLLRAEKALQHKLKVQTLTTIPGLNLKRSQILGFEGRPLIQLAFLSKAGAPIALCIIPSGGAPQKTPIVDTMEGLAAASWSKSGYEYLLIGGKDEALIRNAAQTFHKQL